MDMVEPSSMCSTSQPFTMPSRVSSMWEHCEVAGNCDERLAGWIAGSTAVPRHTRTSGMKSGGESGRRIAEPSIGFVTRTLFGMSGRMVSVLASTS